MSLQTLVEHLPVTVTEHDQIEQGKVYDDRATTEFTTGENTLVTPITATWSSGPTATQLAEFRRILPSSAYPYLTDVANPDTPPGPTPPSEETVMFQINASDLPSGNLAGTTVQDQTGNWDINFSSDGSPTIQVVGGQLVSDQADQAVVATITKNSGYGGDIDEVGRWNYLLGADANITSGGVIMLGTYKAASTWAMGWGYTGAGDRGWRLGRLQSLHSNTGGSASAVDANNFATPAEVACAVAFYYNDAAGLNEFFSRVDNTLANGLREETTATDQHTPTTTVHALRLYAGFQWSGIRILRDINEAWDDEADVDSVFQQWDYTDTEFPLTRDKA